MLLPSVLRSLKNPVYSFIALIGRSLRKRSVLAAILAGSFLYCALTLLLRRHLHLQHRHQQQQQFASDHGDDPDIDEKSDQLESTSPWDLSQFAFLKRQHKLKEILGDEANARDGDGAWAGSAGNANAHHNSNSNNHNNNNNHHHGQNSWHPMLTEEEQENGPGIKCRNSVQGRVLIADDRGYLCPRSLVGINGCCDETASDDTLLYSCHTCMKPKGCCASYEHCISCCMSPEHRDLLNRIMSEVRQQRSALGFKIFLGSITDYFELCLTKCRTSSASVLHENTYRDPTHKYCYTIQDQSF